MSAKEALGYRNLANAVQRKIDSLYFYERVALDNPDEMTIEDKGEYQALENMLLDSRALNEAEFISKYLQQLKSSKERSIEKHFNSDQESEYIEAYKNNVSIVLALISPSILSEVNL
ncbi:hypothetical protein [Paraglaciecola marina]|uniref:hypothetical protein n=1 Tax=Paraglaciecola marina TaxID=2500157 RepID=UPI00105F5E04|nr:hypothetical protein [Paraglaciecola marina]